MLLALPTQHGAGASLFGDYWDLDNLHETIHSLVENSPLNEGLQKTALGLAYDIRHAYQRDREEREFGNDEYDTVVYRGAKILWPILLFQMSLLRYSASFKPTTKEQQANLYRLESCVENALLEYDDNAGRRCIEWLNSIPFVTQNYLSNYVPEIAYRFIEGSPGKRRFKKLPVLLRQFSVMSDEYKEFEKQITEMAKEKNCHPQELEVVRDWPEIDW